MNHAYRPAALNDTCLQLPKWFSTYGIEANSSDF